MVNETLYSIIFLDNERNPIPNCYFELTINGHVITGQANNYGEVQFNRQLVESTPTEYKELNLTFWNEKFPKTEHSTTDSFVWPEGKTSIKALMPDTYIINTRSILNEDDEPQEYQRAYYLVRKGDTWSGLEAKLGINKVEALMFYNRMSYSDQLVEGAKLYYPLGFRTKKEKTEKGEKTNSSSTKQQRSQENGKPIEVASKRGECFCYRDFTVEEFKTIVKELRKGVLKHTNLWIPAISSGAAPSDKTYEATVKELNRIMNKYEINTCLRKIHFLAQAYHETHYFQSMQEYTSPYTSKYDPYRGRGLIHLTHKKNYEKFSADMGDSNIVNNPSIVAINITYAFESGGWFWKKGATLSNNKPGVWRYPNSAPKSIHDRIKMEGANCNKSIVSYGNLQGTFGVLDLNVLADNDWGNTISWLINGGANGFDDRIKYRNLLKEIMKYELCKNKK
jgi:hypothetical protein